MYYIRVQVFFQDPEYPEEFLAQPELNFDSSSIELAVASMKDAFKNTDVMKIKLKFRDSEFNRLEDKILDFE